MREYMKMLKVIVEICGIYIQEIVLGRLMFINVGIRLLGQDDVGDRE
jgi:hypothetical protein